MIVVSVQRNLPSFTLAVSQIIPPSPVPQAGNRDCRASSSSETVDLMRTVDYRTDSSDERYSHFNRDSTDYEDDEYDDDDTHTLFEVPLPMSSYPAYNQHPTQPSSDLNLPRNPNTPWKALLKRLPGKSAQRKSP